MPQGLGPTQTVNVGVPKSLGATHAVDIGVPSQHRNISKSVDVGLSLGLVG